LPSGGTEEGKALKRINVTGKIAPRIRNTGRTQPLLDPQYVAEALGAEVIGSVATGPNEDILAYLASPDDEELDRTARRARIIRVVRRSKQEGLYDQAEHATSKVFAIDPIVEDDKPRRKVKMVFVVDKFDNNQGRVTCPCGAQFDDWATLYHICPECGATDEGV